MQQLLRKGEDFAYVRLLNVVRKIEQRAIPSTHMSFRVQVANASLFPDPGPARIH